MIGAHWGLLAAFAGFAVLVVLLRWRYPRVWPSSIDEWRSTLDAIDAAHIEHQREWSTRTFGPGLRLGVIDHIRKELIEIEEDPADLGEWVDVIILGFDGAWRAGHEPQAIIDAVKAKQARNEARTWPDWRTADRDKAIEHERRADWVDEPGDPTHEQIDQALDIATEVDRAKSDHLNAAMQRAECAWTHLTDEEAADCPTCSPSALPRRIEGGDEHG